MALRWIASYPKSGNTWVRALLEGYLRGAPPKINGMGCVKSDVSPALYEFGLRADHGATGAQASRTVALMRMAEISVWPSLYKTHIANASIGGIPAMPEGSTERALYIVRDPRDVVSSYAKHLGKTVDEAYEIMVTETAWDLSEVKQFLSSWANHVRSWMRADFPVALVRYEDLLEDTPKRFRQIVEFFGFPVDEQRVLDACEWASFDRLKGQEVEHGFRERSPHSDSFFDKGRAQRWREVFGDNPPIFDAELLAELNYDPNPADALDQHAA